MYRPGMRRGLVRKLATTGGLLALLFVSACASRPAISSKIQPGTPCRLELLLFRKDQTPRRLAVLNRSSVKKLRDSGAEASYAIHRRDRSQVRDSLMAALITALEDDGIFDYAMPLPPAGASCLAIRLEGKSYYLVNPAQGGRMLPGQLWRDCLAKFMVAYNSGIRYRGAASTDGRKSFDPYAEQRRLKERNRQSRLKLQRARRKN